MKRINKVLVNAWTYVIGTLLCFGLALICFLWRISDEISLDQPIDPAVWGQYGDFVGGTIGVIFSMISIIFVSVTFMQQREVAESQQQLSNLQRFNDMYFELLRLYQEQEKELEYSTPISSSYTLKQNYKDFFDGVKTAMERDFVPSTSFSKNRKKAVEVYIHKTAYFGGKLSICYRTLFRMLDRIDTEKLDDEKRIQYVKILRAQLTDSELLCIRYHIRAGHYRRFAYLVNKYHIMKHLQLSELLEFNYWFHSEKLNDVEKLAVNRMFEELSKGLRAGVSDTWKSPTGMLKVSYTITPTKLEIVYFKKTDRNKADSVSALFKFSNDELLHLFQCYLKELVVFSNFSSYNDFTHLQFDNNIEMTDTGDKYITSVRNKKNNRLYISFVQNQMSLEKMQTQIY